MKENDEVIRLLESIDRRLALLTVDQERAVRAHLGQTLLTSEARRRMFAAIDGSRGSSELAATAGVSDRAAQLFVKELLELAIVREKPGAGVGRAVIVEPDQAGIVAWYLQSTAQ